MNIFIITISIFALLIIITSFIDIKLSIALYASYQILVPYLEFNFIGISLSYNLVNIVLLLAFIYFFKFKKYHSFSFKEINPFLFLYLSLLIISILTWKTPWTFQFNAWRISFMKTCIISFIVWNISIVDPRSFKYFKYAFFISTIIACIYGIYLMSLNGLNPYTSLLSQYFGTRDFAEIYSTGESRVNFSTAGKIQSTMSHPMSWALFLCISLFMSYSMLLKDLNKHYLKSCLTYILLFTITFNIIISGVRTAIAALSISYLYIIIRNRKIKQIGFFLVITSITFVIVKSNDDLTNLFTSFVDVSNTKSDVKGSSISMRLDQLKGAFNEIKDSKLFGNGYEWHFYYLSNRGDHPILLAFESLIFIILCNSGYFGVIIWLTFFYLLLRVHRKVLIIKEDIYLIDSFVIGFFSFAIGTGEYGYLPMFGLYHSFLLSYFKHKQMKLLFNYLQTKQTFKLKTK